MTPPTARDVTEARAPDFAHRFITVEHIDGDEYHAPGWGIAFNDSDGQVWAAEISNGDTERDKEIAENAADILRSTIAAALAAARRETVEACCAAVCVYCAGDREGYLPAEFSPGLYGPNNKIWLHPLKGYQAHMSMPCDAANIRAAAARRESVT